MFLLQQPPAFIALFALLGLAMGSFGNVIVFRLMSGEPLGGRSHCKDCEYTLSAIELVPLLSWLWLRGKCRKCSSPISVQYPLVELLGATVFIIGLYLSNSWFAALILSLALWLLVLIAVIDARTQGIPDALNLPFVFLSIIFFWSNETIFDPSAFAIGVGFFFGQWAISRGRWIGSGDVLLSIGLSALLGTPSKVIIMIFSAYILGASYAATKLLLKKISRQDHIAFGPFLVLGTAIALLAGESISSCFDWSQVCVLPW